MPEAIQVVIEDDNSTQIDPETGAIEIPQPDGGVVINLDDHRKKEEAGEQDWFKNLANDIDPHKLSIIANDLLDAIEADARSRQGHLDVIARGMSLLGLKLEQPRSNVGDSSATSEGLSPVTNPLLLEAILKGWANARAELLPAEGPVKIAIEGDETAQQDELAEALERDMNFYLTKTASEYVPETSYMILWGTYFTGSGFKKVYRCPMRRRPVSETVKTEDLIVSDTAKDLKSCSRITHQIQMRPSVMKRMMNIGAYRDVQLTQPTSEPNRVEQKIAGIQGTQFQTDRPEDQPYNLYETQCEIDLPDYAPKEFKDTGIPLPYAVTIDKDSREILALRRDWKEDDEDAERRQMYVKFPYIPGPGFYGTGLLNILGNLSAAMTAVDREGLDAGMFANFPGGVIDKAAVRQNSPNFRVAPGEFAPIETGGKPINQVAMPLPYHDVTPGLLKLRDALLAQAKSLSGAAEITVGEGLKDIPVGTMLAQIEQSTKVMSASHKDQHTAHADEIELIIELFRENPEDFFRGVKKRKKFDKRNRALLIAQGVNPAEIPQAPVIEWDEPKFLQALDDYQLIPRSDPNTPSHLHRVTKAVAYSQIVVNPAIGAYFDKKKIAQMICRALKDNPDDIVIDPPPQQGMDPAGMAKMLEVQVKDKQANAKIADIQQKGQLEQVRQAGEQKIEETRLAREEVIHQADLARAEKEHQADMAKAAAEMHMQQQEHQQSLHLEHAKHGLAVQAHEHEMGLKQQDQMHRQSLAEDQQQHAQGVAEYQAMNPPEQPKGGSKK
jgi:hypothetical protein